MQKRLIIFLTIIGIILGLGKANITNAGLTPSWCHDFEQNLKFGDQGEEVMWLQNALQEEGFTIFTNEKQEKLFSYSTASAVVGFQEKYASEILQPLELEHGTGYVGPRTRAKLNDLYGCPQPSITVLSPNGGEEWEIGKTYEIRWESQGVETVDIRAVTIHTSPYGVLIATGIPASQKTYSWTISSYFSPRDDYKISISGKVNGEVISDESDDYFSIIKPITCTDSDGGKNYYEKGTVTVDGTSYTDYCVNNYTLKEYFCTEITTSGLGGAAEEIYQCPYGCRNGACLRESELPDLIITSVEYTPSSPTPNDTLEFRVTVKNIGEDIESLVSGGIITRISSESLPSPGWRICDAIIDPLDSGESVVVDCPIFTYLPTGTHQFTFFVDYDNRIVEADESNNTYTIQVRVTSVQPSITVIAPNGGERWEIGKKYNIYWESTGISSDYKIRITLINYGTSPLTETDLIYNLPGNLGSYSWYLSENFQPGDAYKIKIEACKSGMCYSDESDRFFSIIKKEQEDPVTGTLSSDKTQAKVGENITLTVSAQDDQGVYKVMVYYKGRWHSKYCNNAKECTKTWTFTESTSGTKYYYGYVYGRRLNGRLEGKWTTPKYVRVEWEEEITPTCTDSDGGKNYYVKGTVTVDGTRLTDFCIDSKTLKEHYCMGSNARYLNYTCPYGCENGACRKQTPQQEDPVTGTLSSDKTQAKVGENITLTVSAQDDQGVYKVMVYYKGRWHSKYCNNAKECTKTWTFTESTSGTKYYYGYVYGRKLNGRLEGRWTTPKYVRVEVSSGGGENLPDLVIEDIFYQNPYIKVRYCNKGNGWSSSDFLIKLRNEATGKEYGGNPYYRFSVPQPGECKITGGYSPSLIGLNYGQQATVTGIIDWEQRVKESNENNNSFTKTIGSSSATTSLEDLSSQIASLQEILKRLMEILRKP